MSEPGDAHEREAERAADEVMRTPDPARAAPVGVTGGGGTALGERERGYFEPRFGVDFGAVRVHADAAAGESARAVDALAYTLGRDIVFGEGQYAPETDSGRRLLAHELAHVVQQGSDAVPPAIQRMKIGKGTRTWTDPAGVELTLDEPLAAHMPRLDAAIARVGQVATNPTLYAACHDLFRRRCTCGKQLDLRDAFDAAEVWRYPGGGPLQVGAVIINAAAMSDSAACDPVIVYFDDGMKESDEDFAGTLIHEMGHMCGMPKHRQVDELRVACLRGAPTLAAVRFGVDWDRNLAAVVGFRRMAKNWFGGRQELRWGLDVDLASIKRLAYSEEGPGELVSLRLGFEERVPLRWGGERWGGLSLFSEFGAGFGRFNVRQPTPSDPPVAKVRPGVVVSVGARFEWFFPVPGFEGGSVGTAALTAGYQFMLPVPLNSDTEMIHGLMFGFEFAFGGR